jgi:hypothetical protein
MRKLVLSFVLLFGLFIGLSFTENIVEAAEPDRSESFSLTYTFHIDGGTNETGSTTVFYGDSINIDEGSITATGYEYVGYIVNNKVEPTINQSSSVTVTQNTEIKIFFKPENTTAVILMDANQDYLGVWYADSGNSNYLDTSSNALPNLSNYSKPGLTTDGWTTDGVTVISDLSTEAFTTDDIVYIKYSDPATADLTLTVTNGSGDGTFKFNQTVTVDTTSSVGTTFNYWLKDGEIASYNESYTFTMATNHTLEAVYDEEGFTPHSGSFVAVSETYDLRTGYQSIIGQFDLADGEQLVEYGVLYSDEETTPTLGTSNTTIKNSNKYNPDTNEFVLSFSNLYNPLGKNYRAFITTIDASNTVSTEYSEVLTNSISYTKVWFYNSDSWSTVYAFSKYFVGENEINDLGSFPGTLATQDGSTNWWYIYVPKDVSSIPVTMTFSDDNTNQTPDILIDVKDSVYTTVDGAAFNSKALAENSTLASPTIRTVYFYNSDNWLSVDAYVYGGTVGKAFGQWDGIDATQVGDSHPGWWSVDVPVVDTDSNTSGLQYSFNIIFNYNGSSTEKTTDISIDESSNSYSTISGNIYADFSSAEATLNTTVVWYYNSDNYSSINVYVFNNSTYTNSWPGEGIVIQDQYDPDWWYVILPIDTSTSFSVIFNNGSGGSGNQTADIDIGNPHNKQIYTIVDGQYFSNKQDAEDEVASWPS